MMQETTLDSFTKMVKTMIPDAIIDKTYRTGEIVISTGLQVIDGKVVPLDDDFLR